MATVPLPPLANAVKLSFQFSSVPTAGPPARGFNILHLQYPTPITFDVSGLLGVANGGVTWWTTHYQSLMANLWGLNAVVVTAIDGTGTQGVSSSARVNGLSSDTPHAPQVSVAISWLGAPAYRGGKPRTYLCGIPQSAINTTSAQVNSVYAGNVQSAAATSIGDMTPFAIAADTPVLGAVSYIKKSVNPTPPYHRPTPLFWKYTGARVHQRADSQRRRSGKESVFPLFA